MEKAKIEKVIENLKSRKFDAYYVDTKEEAVKLALSLIPEGKSVSWGGSETITSIGLIDAVKNGKFEAIDRMAAKTPEEKDKATRDAFFCDTYLMSTNAMSADGVLVNIDGNANRVAALAFGPRQVIVVAGVNKICDTVEEALKRARNVAAPKNVARFHLTKTPCSKTGECGNCRSEDCICATITFTRLCRTPGRTKVIIVGEELGY